MSSWSSSAIFGNKKALNQRQDSRHPVSLEVRLNSPSACNALARITDISLNGCYITTILSIQEGEKMQLSILLPSGKVLEIKATVVFFDPPIGFGVEFNLTESQTEFMRDLIDFSRQDS